LIVSIRKAKQAMESRVEKKETLSLSLSPLSSAYSVEQQATMVFG